MTFKNAINNQPTSTLNGMSAHSTSLSACVDLFYKIGASRGNDIIPAFIAALVEDNDLALRIVAWARDVRQGAGERGLFRQVLAYLENNQSEDALRLMRMIPELGRFDDLLVFKEPTLKAQAFKLIQKALESKNGLAAKWMPRKGLLAVELRSAMGLTPKSYRQRLVSLTKVVETAMCANTWDDINFSQVPSLAQTRYRKAFYRHGEAYKTYVGQLVKGDRSVKVNAEAVYPYDVLQGAFSTGLSRTEKAFIEQQWKALPNFIRERNVLPLVDVSGSMNAWVDDIETLSCLEVAVGLGLYFADKNQGVFKDCFLTFSGEPQLLNLKGTVFQKIRQMRSSHWEMNTNLDKALQLILTTALKSQVKPSEMPEMLIIFSDMQFDACANFTGFELIKAHYEAAGYKLPVIIFWNLKDYENVPVQQTETGVALVSGFSPSVVKSILEADLNAITPQGIMLSTVMKDRYNPECYA